MDTATPLSGASDHGISEAIYLPDPDGNGIELAADRAHGRWGDLRDPATIGPRPLDMRSLLALDDSAEHDGASPDLVVGHVHLHVGDVERGLAFYRDAIGFEVMTRFPTAAFVAAGGYHHHLALNTWLARECRRHRPAWPGCASGRSSCPGGRTSTRCEPACVRAACRPDEVEEDVSVQRPRDHRLRVAVERG